MDEGTVAMEAAMGITNSKRYYKYCVLVGFGFFSFLFYSIRSSFPSSSLSSL